MKYVYLNDGIKPSIPDDWEIENSEKVTSLFDPINGVGSMELSFYDVPNLNSIDLKKELKEYLSDKYKRVRVNQTVKYASSSIINDNIYWRYWLLKANKTIVFISYNCKKEDMGKEDSIIDNIIKSI